jgi:glucosamine--fructose-6-phosphate aminotransferase (isomerizing)
MTAALITKETAKIPTEGMVGGQFRHGPMEVIAPPVTTVIFASSGRTRDLNVNLARDLAGREGPVVMIGMSVPGALHIAVPSTDEWLTPILEIVPIQMIAAELAAQRGLQVGHFRYGQKVTTTE